MQLEQTELLKKFSELVVEKNKVHNLTSAKTPEEFFRKHVGDCIGAYRAAEKSLQKSIVDCGSGAGLPSVVWAIINPKLEIHSIDSNQKKIAFQKHIKRSLGLTNLYPTASRIQDFCPKKESTAIFKAFSSIKNGAQSLNQQAPFKNLIFLKKDDEKTKEEITEASSLLYDYKRHEYTANKEKMLVVELYDSKNSNN